MSKIICDVCGTSYQETATQCPICGCVRPADARVIAGSTDESEAASGSEYTYVKGGRFSKANVKKRNNGVQPEAITKGEHSDGSEPEKKNNTGLVIAVCVLLLAIVAVVIYIALHFFAPGSQWGGNADDTTVTTAQTEASTVDTTVLELPCEEIVISKTIVDFDKAGAGYLLNVTVNPKDTTDELTFTSADETVATVSAEGKIIAVGPGETTITVTCGNATAECRVICNIETEPTETTEATVDPSAAAEEFKLNREDFTLTSKGATWTLYTGDIPVKQITWTSDNEKVATIKDGVVTAVGTGTTKVHAEYNGVKRSCTVRCSAAVGTPTETPEETEANDSGYNISSTDVTIAVGEVFTLKLLDADDKAVSVIWSVENGQICSVTGNEIKGLAAGTTTVSVVYEGQTYSCTVRVK